MSTMRLPPSSCRSAHRCPRLRQNHKTLQAVSIQPLRHPGAAAAPVSRERCSRVYAAQGFAPPKETGSVKKFAKKEQLKVADKLIKAFQKKQQSDWRKLIAFSKQWPQLADSVFARTDELIKTEQDPETKLKLRRFSRGLRNAHDDVTKYREFYSKFEYADESEYEAIVAGNEDTLMSAGFFDFLGHIATAAHDDVEAQERIIVTGNRIAAIHEAYAKAAESQAQLAEAHAKLQDVLQVETLDEADQKIDKMAAEGQIDPAFLLTMAKAYSGVKESDMAQEEVKDIMYHLYMKAKEATERGAPPEVRILKHLVSIEDPRHRASELENAFKPGDMVTEKEDHLSTQPRTLLATVETVINAYEGQKGKTSMLGQTAELMDPEVIERMRDVKQLITNKYL
eukprot:jgi/Ulvmu1/3663/UM017_0077.1